ncbi:hypothetical protein D3C87_1919650 [compost metagenome]
MKMPGNRLSSLCVSQKACGYKLRYRHNAMPGFEALYLPGGHIEIADFDIFLAGLYGRRQCAGYYVPIEVLA